MEHKPTLQIYHDYVGNMGKPNEQVGTNNLARLRAFKKSFRAFKKNNANLNDKDFNRKLFIWVGLKVDYTSTKEGFINAVICYNLGFKCIDKRVRTYKQLAGYMKYTSSTCPIDLYYQSKPHYKIKYSSLKPFISKKGFLSLSRTHDGDLLILNLMREAREDLTK